MTNPSLIRYGRPWLTTVVAILLLASSLGPATAAQPASADDAANKARQKREKAFMDQLSGTTLTGFFSTIDQKPGAVPNSDSYEITKVTKAGNFFLFHAKFGNLRLPPLPLRVVWAGTKPVITMNKIPIPGLVTFSVHLIIDKKLYAGTWSHGETLGHMWGTIKKTGKKPTKKATGKKTSP